LRLSNQRSLETKKELFFLLLGALGFMFVLISSYNFITMFISIIGFSLALYIVLLHGGSNSHAVRESGIKYFYLSAFSSGLILYGVFIIYFVCNTTSFRGVKYYINIMLLSSNTQNYESILALCILFLFIGFLFKLSAFPCHM